jgi:predicted anti-sigma-YlaC factor YlaD
MMHRIIRDHLEQILGERPPAPDHLAGKHLAECGECREAVAAMREQAAMLQQWRAPEMEPRPGFYARVLERIEAQTPSSVFTLFFDSLFGRRIAMASLALALLLGVYLISSEQMAEPQVAAVNGLPQVTLVSDRVSDMPQEFPVFTDDSQSRLVTGTPDEDAVLVNLVTYREQ